MGHHRVLFLQGTAGFGGSKQVLLNLIDVLPPDIEAMALVEGTGWFTDQLRRRGVRFLDVPFPAWRKLLGPMRVRSAIRRDWLPALSGVAVDCVYANELPWSAHAGYLARALGRPAIVHLHGAYTTTKARKHRLNEIDAVIACSTDSREALSEDPQLYRRTTTIFAGLAPRQFASQVDRATARSRLGLAPHGIAIGNVGKLCERKNQRLLLAALGRLKKDDRIGGFRAMFAGGEDAAYRQAMNDDIERLGLGANVHFAGHIENIGEFLAAMDMVVHCARSEGLALALLEAMQAGKAIIATQVEGARDAMPDDRFGLVVAPGDAVALSEAIVRLADDAERRASMGTNAHARAESEFGLDVFAGRMEKAIRAALARRVAG